MNNSNLQHETGQTSNSENELDDMSEAENIVDNEEQPFDDKKYET